jgi:hypothetical protein
MDPNLHGAYEEHKSNQQRLLENSKKHHEYLKQQFKNRIDNWVAHDKSKQQTSNPRKSKKPNTQYDPLEKYYTYFVNNIGNEPVVDNFPNQRLYKSAIFSPVGPNANQNMHNQNFMPKVG